MIKKIKRASYENREHVHSRRELDKDIDDKDEEEDNRGFIFDYERYLRRNND